jgi:hypothetical protein
VSTRQVLRLGEAIYSVLRRAGFSDQAVIGTVHALLTTYILGFVALEVPGPARPRDQRRVHLPHVGLLQLPAPGEFQHHGVCCVDGARA